MLRLQQVNRNKFSTLNFSLLKNFAAFMFILFALNINAQDCSSVSNTIGDLIYLGEYNNSKYYCSSHNNYTWHQAKAEIEAYGGQMLIIDDAAENEFVRSSIMADYVWHNLSDANNEGDFRTTTGEAAPYLNWNSGEPNNSNGTEHYARILKSNGQWTDRDEWFTAEYVMEIACGGNQVCKNRTAENVINCGNGITYGGWLKFNEYSTNHYTLSNAVLTEYTDGTGTYAGTWIHNDDASLVFDFELTLTGRTTKAPNTPKPHNCLTPNESNYYYYEDFTGILKGRQSVEGAIISIQSYGAAFQLGIGANATGTDHVFGGSAWFSGELLSGPTTGSTLTLQGNPGDHFGDINIKLSERVNGDMDNNGVCDIEECSSAPEVADMMYIGTFNGSYYYKKTGGDITYTEAKAFVEARGGHLPVVNDAQENSFLTSLLEGGAAWIGLSDAEVEGQFKWTNGQALSYTNWNTNEPNDYNGEDYAEILSNGKWNDLPIGAYKWAIMELPCENITSIGDKVFADDNSNGIQDNGEGGVENVDVTLFAPGNDGVFHTGDDVVVDTDQTDANGNYLFEDVTPGTYCIEFDITTIPVDYVFTGKDQGGDDTKDSDVDAAGKTDAFTVTSGAPNDPDYDAGIKFDLPDFGDKVFADDNSNGIQDNGEGGVENVDVTLYGPGNDGIFHTGDDVVVDTDQTDANGNYLFEDVAPGTYCIEFDITTIPTNYVFTGKDQGGDDTKDSDVDAAGKTDAFTVTAGQPNDPDYDAGIKFDLPDFGDKVFADDNSNGIQDNGEGGVENVNVTLFSAGNDGVFHTGDDVVVDTDQTDANGNYLFEDVAPGTYCIEFDITTIPVDYVFTGKDQGGDDTKDSDVDAAGKTDAFTVTAGQPNDPDYDAGIKFDLPDIGDKVFADDNLNGIQDNNEGGVENVNVTLFSAGPDGVFHTGDDVAVDTDQTDANGNYLFVDVAPGTYCIEFDITTIPVDFIFTGKDNGSNDAIDSDVDAGGKTDAFTVTAGQPNDPDYDAGIRTDIPDIGNKVFFDDNKNGVQDLNEAGVENVTVRLYSAGPDGVFHTGDDVLFDTDQTDANGDYIFDDVDPGVYCIGFDKTTLPAGFGFTFRDLGNDDALDSDADLEGKTDPFTVTSGQPNDPDYDAGIFESGSIGNKVWDDQNGNGVQDTNEPGIQGVFVFLEDVNGNPVPNVMYQVTDVNGAYLFAGLPLDDYVVRFATPGGLFPTDAGLGGDDTKDSNASILDGRSGVITIDSSNPDDLTVDAGFVTPVKITGIVWFDVDEDGTQGATATEGGVAGVKVTLYEAGPDMMEGTADDVRVTDNVTGNDGFYQFFNVLPGKYFVNFDPNTLPTDYEFTMSDLGGDDFLDSDADANTGNSPVFIVNSAVPTSGVDAGIIFSTNLPVDLISFNAELINSDKVLLKWATAWEQNNNFFEVQRSTDGDRFETIGTVTGQGTTNSINNYNFVDEAPFYGRNYYRLKQVDYDGTTDLSEVQSILIDNEALPDVIAYPNPTKDVTTLRVVTPFEEDATVEVINSAGQILEVIVIQEGSNSQQIDLSQYQPGFYFLNIKYNGFRKLVHRVLKVRD